MSYTILVRISLDSSISALEKKDYTELPSQVQNFTWYRGKRNYWFLGTYAVIPHIGWTIVCPGGLELVVSRVCLLENITRGYVAMIDMHRWIFIPPGGNQS